MGGNSRPGVVLVNEFWTKEKLMKRLKGKKRKKSANSFSNFTDYLEREGATSKREFENKTPHDPIDVFQEELNFSGYQNYMDNPEKTSASFSAEDDFLPKNKAEKFKEFFDKSFEQDELMWSTIISFDNEWLKENGLLSDENKLDEKKVKDAIRKAMKVMGEKHKAPTLIWTGAIHYNTDNIHVHIASVEVVANKCYFNEKANRYEQRGKLKQSTIDGMKSKVANTLLERAKEQKKINDLIRDVIVKEKKESHSLADDKEFKNLFKEIVSELPGDKRQWQYNYNSIGHVRPKIDELSKMYIEKYHKETFEEFNKLLEDEVKIAERTYGSGDRHLYAKLKDNKVQDLYTRLGNSILNEMKSYDNAVKKSKDTHVSFATRLKSSYSLTYSLKRLDYLLNDDMEHWKNQRVHDKLMQKIEHENESEHEV